MNLIIYLQSLNIKFEDYNLEKLIVYLISNNIYKKIHDYIKKNIFKFIELFFLKKLNKVHFKSKIDIYNLHSKLY